jgi:hypothetical protein
MTLTVRKKLMGADGMAQAVEHLSSKCESLSSKPSTTKKKETKGKERKKRNRKKLMVVFCGMKERRLWRQMEIYILPWLLLAVQLEDIHSESGSPL